MLIQCTWQIFDECKVDGIISLPSLQAVQDDRDSHEDQEDPENRDARDKERHRVKVSTGSHY